MTKQAELVLEAVLEVGLGGYAEPWEVMQAVGSEVAARGLAELEALGLAFFGGCGRVYVSVPEAEALLFADAFESGAQVAVRAA